MIGMTWGNYNTYVFEVFEGLYTNNIKQILSEMVLHFSCLIIHSDLIVQKLVYDMTTLPNIQI